MKKTFKNPLKKASAPLIFFAAVGTQKKAKSGESDQEDDDDGDGEDSDLEEGLKSALKNAKDLAEKLGDAASKTEVDAIKTAVQELKDAVAAQQEKNAADAIKTINDNITKLWQANVEKLENEEDGKGGKGEKGNAQIINRKQVEQLISAHFDEDGRKIKGAAESIQIKAPEIFGIPQSFVDGADISAFTGRFVDPELNQRRRKKNIILDYFNIRSINVPTLIYLEKVEIGAEPDEENAGGAAWILCGQQKPMRSFKVTSAEVTAKKLAIFGTIEDCLLKRVDSFENWIREDFTDEMREKYNEGLLKNDPLVNSLAPMGLLTNATQFVATAAFANAITAPNYVDAILAAAAAMEDARETPEFVFVSSDIRYMIIGLKDANARYQNKEKIFIDDKGQVYIDGIAVIGVDKEDVPNTHFLMIGENVGFKIYNYGDMVFESGLNGEDFRHDRTSYRAYQEVLSYISTHREAGVMYDTWANVFAAIAAPEPEPEPEV